MTPKVGDTVHPTFESLPAGVMRQDQEVGELHLLLPRYQADELEAVAHRRGMTTGQMLRRVIGEMLASQAVASRP